MEMVEVYLRGRWWCEGAVMARQWRSMRRNKKKRRWWRLLISPLKYNLMVSIMCLLLLGIEKGKRKRKRASWLGFFYFLIR
jgi:hypothetical protein